MEPTTEQIEEQLNKAVEQGDEGGSKWPGMTYEEGVRNALEWVLGDYDHAPMEG